MRTLLIMFLLILTVIALWISVYAIQKDGLLALITPFAIGAGVVIPVAFLTRRWSTNRQKRWARESQESLVRWRAEQKQKASAPTASS
jgi:hypothetical protein